MGALTASNEKTKLLRVQKVEESSEKNLPYPKCVFFIIGNEFCERFSYYGLRTILVIYMTQRLYYSDSTATTLYHLFTAFAYFTPILGAILADSWLGKFNTILYLSILYSGGCILLSFGSFPQAIGTMKLMSLLALFIIAVGTGGIKPCVSAFGGDQFKEGQEKQLAQFFSLFYLSINLGSTISTYVTPFLRSDVHCLGENTCYPLAYGVPAILMIVSVLFFVCGKSLYVIRPPEGNILVKVSTCIFHALRRKCSSSEKKKPHWLDYADDKFEKKLISDIKTVFHVLVLFVPLPVFWALFDQQGSKWTLQAVRMDGYVYGFHIKPDQMQVINPLLIVLFIPLFQYVIYPVLAKCNMLTKPLTRITLGGFLAAVSFVVAGLIELKLETALPFFPEEGLSELTIINNSPCVLKIEAAGVDAIEAFQTRMIPELESDQLHNWAWIPENCTAKSPLNFAVNSSYKASSIMITLNEDKLSAFQSEELKVKSKKGFPKVKLYYSVLSPPENTNLTFKFLDKKGDMSIIEAGRSLYGITKYEELPSPGSYKIYASYSEEPLAEIDFATGGVYIVNLYNSNANEPIKYSVYEMVRGNFLNILFQAPQYILITAGEVMFSITGLEFSYSQSPTSMKSVVQAAWLLTVAFGNILVLIIEEISIFNLQSSELFFFGTLMAVDMLIFGIMAYFYKYVTIKASDQEDAAVDGQDNDGYLQETDFNK